MNLCECLTRPLMTEPVIDFVNLPAFEATDDAGRDKEVRAALRVLQDRAREFTGHPGFARRYLEEIAEAEEAVDKKAFRAAHKAIWQAVAVLNQAIESASPLARQIRWRLVFYLTLWLACLLLTGQQLFFGEVAGRLWFGSDYWRYGLMGALGGITVAYWGLLWHTVGLDFDCRYRWWYIVRPILGGVSGLVAVLVVKAGFLAVQGSVQIKNQLPLYVIAFLVGFSERSFLQIIDRVMTVLFKGDASQEKKPARRPAANGKKAGEA